MRGSVLSVERRIASPPGAIFDILGDAAKHALIDGSGSVQGLAGAEEGRGTSQPLELGSTFRMGMRIGVRYTTVNRVVEFEPERRIAWRTGPDGRLGRYLAGRLWRYELEPAEGGTLVRESWDISRDHQRLLLKLGGIVPRVTRRHMEQTLARLDAVVTGSAGSE